MKIRKTVQLICILMLSYLTSVSSVVAQVKKSSPVLQTLRQLDLTVVKAKPIDFSLKSVNSNFKKLSQFKGRWIFLTFWATWCGPCKIEMPHLQKLLESLSPEEKKKFSIVGVSIDSERSMIVKKYLKIAKISFPIFHDQSGEVARKYKSSSVPSIYVISPDWKLVGILRGAKEWSNPETVSLVKKLISYKNVPDIDVSNIKNKNGLSSAVIPVEITPPRIRARIVYVVKNKNKNKNENKNKNKKQSANIFEINQIFRLDIAVRWKGNAYLYAFKTPTVKLPEELAFVGDFSSSSSGEDEKSSELIYSIKVKAKKFGNYEIGPIEMGFKARRNGKWQYVRAKTQQIVVKKHQLSLVTYCIFTICILMAILFLVYNHKKQKATGKFKKEELNSTASLELLEEEFSKLEEAKIHLDEKDYQLKLLKFYKKLTISSEEKIKVNQLIESLNYGGQLISKMEMNVFKTKLKNIFEENEKNFT